MYSTKYMVNLLISRWKIRKEQYTKPFEDHSSLSFLLTCDHFLCTSFVSSVSIKTFGLPNKIRNNITTSVSLTNKQTSLLLFISNTADDARTIKQTLSNHINEKYQFEHLRVKKKFFFLRNRTILEILQLDRNYTR